MHRLHRECLPNCIQLPQVYLLCSYTGELLLEPGLDNGMHLDTVVKLRLVNHCYR